MLTEEQLPCRHRSPGQTPKNDLYFQCTIHGQCSLDKEHSRIRSCILCDDRREGVQPENPHIYLGTRIELALKSAGVTKEKVADWLGFDCRCEEHRDKLNQLDRWARRVIGGKMAGAKELLGKLME